MHVVLDEAAVGDRWIATRDRLILRRRQDGVARLVELRAQSHESVLELVPGILVNPFEREVGRRIGRHGNRLVRTRVDIEVLVWVGADDGRRRAILVGTLESAE